MKQENEPLSDVVSQLLKKSVEVNKVFLQEGSRIFTQLGKKDAGTTTPNLLNTEALSNVVNEYVKLNLNHYNNMLDLGLQFIRQAGTSGEKQPTKQSDSASPGFVLEKEVVRGETVHFHFLLDNSKQTTVTCEFIHSPFIIPMATMASNDFATLFNPTIFELKPGESRNVGISIEIPSETPAGRYSSNVQVKGFEPAFFTMHVLVIDSPAKPQPDGGKNQKEKRK